MKNEDDSIYGCIQLNVYIPNGTLQSNPVLEAFGNAKTLRNNNSRYVLHLSKSGAYQLSSLIRNSSY
jgi:hypothetical protein